MTDQDTDSSEPGLGVPPAACPPVPTLASTGGQAASGTPHRAYLRGPSTTAEGTGLPTSPQRRWGIPAAFWLAALVAAALAQPAARLVARWDWRADLLTHFQEPALAATLVGVAALARRHRRLALALGTLAAAQAWCLTRVEWPNPVPGGDRGRGRGEPPGADGQRLRGQPRPRPDARRDPPGAAGRGRDGGILRRLGPGPGRGAAAGVSPPGRGPGRALGPDALVPRAADRRGVGGAGARGAGRGSTRPSGSAGGRRISGWSTRPIP